MIMATFGCVAALTSLFLPEAADSTLPETLAEAEEFGKNQEFLYVPIVSKLRLRKNASAAAVTTATLATIPMGMTKAKE